VLDTDAQQSHVDGVTISNPASGLRWEPLPNGILLRAPLRKAVVIALAAAWNLGCVIVFRKPESLVVVGLLAALAFSYFAIRALRNETRVVFAGDKLVVYTGPLPPRSRFEHLVIDIEGFTMSGAKDHEDGFTIHLLTRGGVPLKLPIDLNAIVLTMRGSARAIYGISPAEHARFVVERLGEALEEARHAASDYRAVGGGPRVDVVGTG